MAEGRWEDDVWQGAQKAPLMSQKGGKSAAAGVLCIPALIVGAYTSWVIGVIVFLCLMGIAALFDWVVLQNAKKGAGH